MSRRTPARSRGGRFDSQAAPWLACVLCLLGTSGLEAQDFQLVVGGPGDDRGIYASETRDGGYVAVGITRVEDEQAFLVRASSEGEVLWTRDLGGSGSEWGWSVHEVDRGFVIAGSTSSIGAGGFDCYLTGTDAHGAKTWERALGGPYDDHCWAMVAHTNGWVVVGETSQDGAENEDCLLAGIDREGRELWSTSFGGPKSDRCFSVHPKGDGWIVAGATFSRGAGDRDLWVVGVDRSGEVLWEKTWGGEASDVAHWVAPTRDGNFLVTGYSTSFATSQDDPFLVKVDARGNEIWTRRLPFDSLVHTIAGVERRGGGLCLSGFEVATEERAALFLRTNDEGEELQTHLRGPGPESLSLGCGFGLESFQARSVPNMGAGGPISFGDEARPARAVRRCPGTKEWPAAFVATGALVWL